MELDIIDQNKFEKDMTVFKLFTAAFK